MPAELTTPSPEEGGPPPSVSLITTVRDCEAYLAEALDSACGQGFGDWELVLWDDGSTDGSPDIARSLAERDSRIRPFRSEAIGRRRALTEAHAQARGEFVGWLDADDRLAPAALQRTVDLLRNTPDCGLVYTDHLRMDGEGRVRGVGGRCLLPHSAHRLLFDFMTFHFRLLRRSVFEQAGGINPALDIAIDYDLCLRASELTQIRHLAEPLYFYREHREQMSSRSRLAQVSASATAIRGAIERRGLSDVYDLQVDIVGSRFRLDDRRPFRRPLARSPAQWARVAWATAFPRFRPSPSDAALPRRIAYWPGTSEDPALLRLYSAKPPAETFIARRVGEDLASLVRAVWTGDAGDLLVIHGVDTLLEVEQHGSALANYWLLSKTLDHAAARGVRTVFRLDAVNEWRGPHADVMERLRRALVSRCHAIVVQSQSAWDQLCREVGTPSARAVIAPQPNAIDVYPDITREYAREKLGLSDTKGPALLYYAPLHTLDGVGRLVEALEQLDTSEPVRLVVAGPVASKKVEHGLVGLAGRSGVLDLRLGAVSPHDVSSFFRACDVAVWSSTDPMTWSGLALAMSMRMPILAPEYAAVAEALPDGNLLYPPTGPAATAGLHRAVERACRARDEWERIGKRNLDRVREWSHERVIDALCGIG